MLFLHFQASRFRSLVGTMTPPDDTDTAEIYVEVRTMSMKDEKFHSRNNVLTLGLILGE